MIICSQQVFDKIFLDREDSEFIKYISYGVERELGKELIDKLKDHKPFIVKLREPRFVANLPQSWRDQCAYRQDLELRKVVQCKDCRMAYPWCQQFRDELGGDGFCPYGNPYDEMKGTDNA